MRELKHLKSGWRWLTDDEAARYAADGTAPRTTPLVKPGLMHRELTPGSGWRRWRP